MKDAFFSLSKDSDDQHKSAVGFTCPVFGAGGSMRVLLLHFIFALAALGGPKPGNWHHCCAAIRSIDGSTSTSSMAQTLRDKPVCERIFELFRNSSFKAEML
jgi:hypothetical protein